MSGGIAPFGQEIYGGSRPGDGSSVTQFQHTNALAISYAIGSTGGSISAGAIWTYGLSRFGDGLRVSLTPKKQALGISYTITPSKYAAPLAISYTIQKPNCAPLLIYYLISPPSAFSINGDGAIIRPDQINYGPRPIVGRTLLAAPLLQGYETMTWSYAVLAWSEFQRIIAHYNPNSPIVTLVYPDGTGTWVQRQVVMHPPVYGNMSTVLIYNVVFSFSILPT